MANEQNLTNTFTKEQNREEAAKNGRKGGVASGKARREKKLFREVMLSIIDEEKKDGKTIRQFLSERVIKKALDGDLRAFEILRDTIGEKPTDKTEISGGLTQKVISDKKVAAVIEKYKDVI